MPIRALVDTELQRNVLSRLGTPIQSGIWMAEDNADVRLLLNRAFKRCGTGVPMEFFLDGAAVLQKAREVGGLPKVLLLDIEMPRMNGLQVLGALARNGFPTQTTAIVFSTVDDPACVEEAYALGASFYVRKPIGGVEYRQFARFCTACVYFPVIHKPVARALNVAEALEIVAHESAAA